MDIKNIKKQRDKNKTQQKNPKVHKLMQYWSET